MRSINLFLVAAAVLALSAHVAQADFISKTLGSAGPSKYGILTLNGTTSVSLSGNGTTNGNVGVSTGGNVQLDAANGTAIKGNLYLASGASVNNPAQVSGTTYFTNRSLTQANIDARNAATAFANLTPTQFTQKGFISPTQTINGTAGLNVIDVHYISLFSGQVLTLNGPANSRFVINTPTMILGSSAIELKGGVTANNVVFNVTGTGTNFQMSNANGAVPFINGIVLDANGSVAMTSGTIDGELIAGGPSVQLTSGASVDQSKSHHHGHVVPSPPSVVLMGLGAAVYAGCAVIRFWRRRRAVPRPA